MCIWMIRLAKHIRWRCHSLEHLELSSVTSVRSPLLHSRTWSFFYGKNLILEGCDCTQFPAITSPKLKSLVIDGGRITCDSPLVIVGPAVALSECAGEVHFNEMPSLAKASILCIHLGTLKFPDVTPPSVYLRESLSWVFSSRPQVFLTLGNFTYSGSARHWLLQTWGQYL
jgi:hypothetical protein